MANSEFDMLSNRIVAGKKNTISKEYLALFAGFLKIYKFYFDSSQENLKTLRIYDRPTLFLLLVAIFLLNKAIDNQNLIDRHFNVNS